MLDALGQVPALLWVKSLHIIFVVAWFAGLFYLPRLFVYHTQCRDADGDARFKLMERKLFGIMTVGAVGAMGFGLWLLRWFSLADSGWLHAKLVLVLGMVAFHGWCWRLLAGFRDGHNCHSERFYRMINEIPALGLIGIVILAVTKPF